MLNENPSDRQVAALVKRLKATGQEGDQLLEDARAAAQKGDDKSAAVKVQQAEKLFQEKLSKNPSDTHALTRLAEISLGHNDLPAALVWARRAAASDKSLRELEAGILGRLGQTDAAIALYEQIVREKPERLGTGSGGGRPLEARAGPLQRRGATVTSGCAGATPRSRGLAVAEAAVLIAQKPERALKFMADHEMEYGGSPEYQLAYGRMQLQMEHYDEALARLTKMVADCKAEITRKQGSTDPAERKAAGQLRRRFAVYEVELRWRSCSRRRTRRPSKRSRGSARKTRPTCRPLRANSRPSRWCGWARRPMPGGRWRRCGRSSRSRIRCRW